MVKKRGVRNKLPSGIVFLVLLAAISLIVVATHEPVRITVTKVDDTARITAVHNTGGEGEG